MKLYHEIDETSKNGKLGVVIVLTNEEARTLDETLVACVHKGTRIPTKRSKSYKLVEDISSLMPIW